MEAFQKSHVALPYAHRDDNAGPAFQVIKMWHNCRWRCQNRGAGNNAPIIIPPTLETSSPLQKEPGCMGRPVLLPSSFVFPGLSKTSWVYSSWVVLSAGAAVYV